MTNHIVGLDVGSSSIKCVVAEVKRDNKLAITHAFKMPSGGLRKGIVDDIGEATYAISNVLGEVRKISKNATKNIYLSVGCADARVQISRGSVAVSRADNEIDQNDISRAVEGSRAIPLPPNRLVLHAITREFVVDGIGDIRDPSGMLGNRLEVSSLIVDAFVPTIKNLTKCIETAGGGVAGLILSPLASARSILSKSQKELGVILVEIGFGRTGLSVYEENKLLHTAIFPVGSGNITNDLAIGLKTAIATAETVKLSFGAAIAKEVSRRDVIELSKIDPKARGVVTRKFVSEIIEVRLAEIFDFVNNELKRIGRHAKLPGGVVIAGGGAKLPGIAELARQELRLSSQIGIPDISGLEILNSELALQLEDPEYACALGLLMWGGDKLSESRNASNSMKGFFKNLLDNFLP
ncbi:MAG: cell division protein FtsA [Patescibacteria group bacterium]